MPHLYDFCDWVGIGLMGGGGGEGNSAYAS